MAQPYKKLEIKKYPRVQGTDGSEVSFWKKFRHPILHSQYTPVTCIDISPVKPHDFVITTAARLQIYSSVTNELKKSITRFKEAAFSGRYRDDGQLIIAGGQEGTIRIFDVKSRSILRTFEEAHTQPIYVTRFSPEKTQIMSCSDDFTACCWDITTQEKVVTLEGHTDKVRAGVISKESPNIWITGSSDHTLKVWDIRTNETVTTIEHNDAIDDILIFPQGGLFASASGTNVRIFDIAGGFRCLETLSNNQKNITALAYDQERGRLLTGGLDNNVKVYDTSTMKVVHIMKYPSPILSMSMSPNSTHLLVGMSDGSLSIKHRIIKTVDKVKSLSQDSPYPTISWKYLQRGSTAQPSASDHKIEKIRKQRLAKYDKFLRKFQYRKALDAALESSSPEIIVSIFEEFIRRHALTIPLSGRNEETLKPILLFLLKFITNPNYMQTLVSVSNILLDIYSPTIGKSTEIDGLYFKLQTKLKEEIGFQKKLFGLVGILDLLIANQVSK